jgi:hypothetical protein
LALLRDFIQSGRFTEFDRVSERLLSGRHHAPLNA